MDRRDDNVLALKAQGGLGAVGGKVLRAVAVGAVALLTFPTIARAADAPPSVYIPTPSAAMAEIVDQLEQDPNVVALTIQGQAVTAADAADTIRGLPVAMAALGFKAVYQYALDLIVRERLMELAARQAGLDKDPVVIRRQKSQSGRVLGDRWLARQVDAVVTEQAVRARYERDIAGKPGPSEVRARVILVATEAEAQSLIERAKAGEDFAALAKRHSTDASSVEGGDLKFATLESVAPEVGSAMFALLPGQTTAFPVRAAAGYFVIRVEGRRRREAQSFEEARAGLTREMRREASAEALRALMGEIKLAPAPAGGR